MQRARPEDVRGSPALCNVARFIYYRAADLLRQAEELGIGDEEVVRQGVEKVAEILSSHMRGSKPLGEGGLEAIHRSPGYSHELYVLLALNGLAPGASLRSMREYIQRLASSEVHTVEDLRRLCRGLGGREWGLEVLKEAGLDERSFLLSLSPEVREVATDLGVAAEAEAAEAPKPPEEAPKLPEVPEDVLERVLEEVGELVSREDLLAAAATLLECPEDMLRRRSYEKALRMCNGLPGDTRETAALTLSYAILDLVEAARRLPGRALKTPAEQRGKAPEAAEGSVELHVEAPILDGRSRISRRYVNAILVLEGLSDWPMPGGALYHMLDGGVYFPIPVEAMSSPPKPGTGPIPAILIGRPGGKARGRVRAVSNKQERNYIDRLAMLHGVEGICIVTTRAVYAAYSGEFPSYPVVPVRVDLETAAKVLEERADLPVGAAPKLATLQALCPQLADYIPSEGARAVRTLFSGVIPEDILRSLEAAVHDVLNGRNPSEERRWGRHYILLRGVGLA